MTVLASAGLMVVLMGLIWRVFVYFDAKNERAHAAIDRAEAHRAALEAIARDMSFLAGRQADRASGGVASGREARASVMLVVSLALSVTSAFAQLSGASSSDSPMLQNPLSEEDWPMRGRTPDGWGYSPLDQINRSNVIQLQIVWSRGFGPNFRQETLSFQETSDFPRQGTSPRVYDGSMYLLTSEGIIQPESVDIQSAIDAIDAATGDIRWRHERYERIDLRNPNVSTGFDMYLLTSEGIIQPESVDIQSAIDATGAATGGIRRRHERIDLRNPNVSTGFTRDLAIVNNYVVVLDTVAADKRVFVLDAATGEHVWPTDTGSTPALGMESVAVADSDLDSCLTQFRYSSTYSPLTEYCMITNGGTVQAISAETNTVVWEHEQETAMGRLAATGGGLVFGGDHGGRFRAFDHETGEVIWETGLGSPITRSPITYAVGGRQYVAIYTDNNVVFAFAVPGDATCPLSVSHSVSVPLTLYHDNPRPYWFFPFILTDVEQKGTIPPEELFMICEVTHRSTWSERSLWLRIVAAGSKRGWVDAGTYDDLEAFLKH